MSEQTNAVQEFVMTRVFDAPRDLVFKMWTEPEHVGQWFGPKGCTIRAVAFDLRPGGIVLCCMKTSDGHEMWGRWVFREIVPPKRLVWVNSFSDENGGLTRHPMSPTWPLEMLTTVDFTEQDGKTKITLQWVPINPTEDELKTFNAGHESMKMGWTGTFDRLEAYLRSKHDNQN